MILVSQSKHRIILGATAIILLALGIVLLLVKSRTDSIGDPLPPVSEPTRATLTGIYLCLPHKDTTGPQTEECAFGLKTDDGSYYALNFALMSQIPPTLSGGERISANGVLTPIESWNTGVWSRYPVRALFSVTDSVQKVGTPVLLYYYNPSLDQGPGGVQCTSKGLVGVARSIPYSEDMLADTIKLLLRGELTSAEKAEDIQTEFPLSGLALASGIGENGHAVLAFNDPQNKTSGGACRVNILRAQIEATAKQFPDIKTVHILPEDLFQP
jgi:hypothetical protein